MQNRGVGGGSSLNLKPPDQLDAQLQDRRVNPQSDQQPQKCPRCDSLNTKFCYYNNYSLSQPRYLCKTCRRYWTKGGTLRNVPVGGGCRKGSKRPKRSVSDTPGKPSTLHQAMAESAVFPPPHIGAIRSQFLANQSSSIGVTSATDAKISETIPPFSSPLTHPQYINHSLTLGDYGATFGSGYHASLLANATKQAPLLPNSEGFLNEIEQWREVSTVHHGSLTKDGSLHLLPRFETTTIARGKEAAAAANVPSLVKPEPPPAFDGNGSASSAGVCYWNNQTSGTSLVGENWPEFSGYTPHNSFL